MVEEVSSQERSNGEVVLHQREGGDPAIELQVEGGTVWLTQQQTADLLPTSRTNVNENLANDYAEGALVEGATCWEVRQVRAEGTRELPHAVLQCYLDAIVSMGCGVGNAQCSIERSATKRPGKNSAP
ncbi:hypothetical protein [Demequina sp. NBRC 110052]|uniref:hypothetical protein n=1 Tax=Demequina sp. NBRC 110052 TaxID=1570341 RepID=UPI00117DFA6C|nr:hypothetical protein [Demequina sp. NBRC 110052]